jgi:hypothetical protein
MRGGGSNFRLLQFVSELVYAASGFLPGWSDAFPAVGVRVLRSLGKLAGGCQLGLYFPV